MARDKSTGGNIATPNQSQSVPDEPRGRRQERHLHFDTGARSQPDGSSSSPGNGLAAPAIPKWSFGILNDKSTEEVPGTVLLLSSFRNEPLGLETRQDQRRESSMPAQLLSPRNPSQGDKKMTKDGDIILEPQPEDSQNDPLNWPAWRRDLALLSLGFYCMLGGGITPILAAGFHDVADTYHVTYAQVALTTGLYMMGLGVGSVLFSPTAILYGKRPVYLASAVMFILTSVWCAMAPSYAQLATARVFQGISVSPVECLPSATIAEIFFLHERAFRVGIYTLLLLGGKNLIPLVSAVIIQAKGWRWVFWVVTIVAAFGLAILFLFVPETFWDRTPRPKSRGLTHRRSLSSIARHSLRRSKTHQSQVSSGGGTADEKSEITAVPEINNNQHVDNLPPELTTPAPTKSRPSPGGLAPFVPYTPHDDIPHLHNLNSPYYTELEKNDDYLGHHQSPTSMADRLEDQTQKDDAPEYRRTSVPSTKDLPKKDTTFVPPKIVRYTTNLRQAPPQGYVQTLKPWNGRLSRSKWFLVALRPFILFSYPAVLWSALVYSLSVGWLIVLSESISDIYRDRASYNFTALQSGLVYLSPFIGGILGTAVAGKVSDIIVRFMARRNGGVYEPEFRLIMGAPIAITTAMGLVGYGWSAEERDNWIVPTIFFGVISFGCSLGSTTSITFCVDSYRQFAGEALVTLNFSKNVFHGLVFSLFFAQWLEHEGPKNTFLVIGCLQIACMVTTIPMYIYGKRARMWTVRRRMMEKF
ncbi:hypothetical protein LTR84_006906 [Exophiala bonariae]|uniref:Major facilitator superfamily (MFS) profile domain-containing protein n=1 Tax=Exophiala bonariae TaxID=1690606 RepID=A0AAV9N0V3_9EURO|nr:hypothetical protein LTR84_006906 [Exophiala bonariae]